MSQPNEGQDRIDYRETADITEVHASIIREHGEPRTGTMPIPMWLGVLTAGTLCWAGANIGAFHGGFSASIYNEYESNPAAFFPLPVQGDVGKAEELPLVQLGEKIFAKNCSVCHQPSGLGQPGATPPLAGSEWVAGSEASEKRLLGILLKGVTGPITVKGNPFNSAQMTGFGSQMKPRELAGVLTYIRQAWGNSAGEITEAHVAAAKKVHADRVAPFTEPELKAIPVGDMLDVPAADAKLAPAPAAGAPKTVDAKPAAPTAAPAASTYDLVASIEKGKMVYMQSCLACHQLTGAGIPGAFPPLIGTDYVNGDTRRLAAIVLKGIAGPIKVNGMVYATGMPNPALTFPILNDDKNVADVLNYVRNSWGNKAEPVITPELIAKIRAEFKDKADQWIEADLLNFPAAK